MEVDEDDEPRLSLATLAVLKEYMIEKQKKRR